MATATTQTDIVRLIAAEIACGIDDAVGYWLGRIERELIANGPSPEAQLRAIKQVLQEYNQVTGKLQFACAQA